MTPHRSHQKVWTAFFWMVLSGLSFSAMSVLVKMLSGHVPTFQIIFSRVFVNFLLISVLVFWKKTPIFPSGRWILVLRAFAGFVSLTCLFFALANLPLPIAGVLNWSSILFVILISALVLKEKLSVQALLWVGMSLLGLLILLNPSTQAQSLDWFWVGIALAGAFFGAVAYVTVRAATGRYSSALVIFYFTGIACVLALPFARFDLSLPKGEYFGMIMAMGAFATLGQYAMTEGYRHAQAGLVSTMSLMNAAMTAVIGATLFDEFLSMTQWMGMFLIILGILLTTHTSQRA